MDFYEAIKPRSTEITLAGEPRTIERARLGRFFRLGELYRKYQEALTKRSARSIEYLLDYLALSSNISRGEWEDCSPLEFADGFLRLVELNNVRINLPIFSESQERKEKVYEYSGRFIATWITRLARMYGWSSEHILNLFPEEAACYIQEAEIQDFNEREFIYRLSDVAYVYDKGTKRSRYVPLKRPGWMLAEKEREKEDEKVRIPAKFIPQGVIIDLEARYGKKKSRSNRE